MADKVVDASALAALVFGEPEGEAVARRLVGHRCIAPALLPFEMSSVCLKKLRRHSGECDAILTRFEKLRDFPVELYPVDPVATVEAGELLSLSAYDASYLLLARQFDAELVTLDAQLHRAWSMQ
jgi:predicted nucleic acid-binding protein